MPERESLARMTWPLVALLLGSAVLFGPLLAGGSHLVPFHVLAGDPALEGLDLAADRPDWRLFDLSPVNTFYAEKALAARQIKSGELPLWNPFNGAGVPLLADGQSQPFAPLFAPLLLFTGPRGYSACLLLQLLFGGLGFTLLLRRTGANSVASAFGVLLFALNPYALDFIVYSDSWAYLCFPWLFLAADLAAERPSRWWLLALAAAWTGASGHVEAAFLGAACAAMYGTVRSVSLGKLQGALGQAVAAPLLALALSAWWVLPFLEWVRLSTSPRFAHSTPYPYHPSALFISGSEIFLPSALMALAVLGWGSAGLAGRRWALLPPGLWAAAMMFPWPEAVQRAASFDFMSGRYGRSVLWFLVSLCATQGVEALSSRSPLGRARWLALLVGACGWCAAFVVTPPSLAAAAANHWVPLLGEVERPLGWFGLASLAALALLAAPERRVSREFAGALVALLVLAPLLARHDAFSIFWNRSEPRLSPVVSDAAASDPGRLWLPERDLWRSLPPNLSAAFGVRDVRYCSPLFPSRLAPLNTDSHPNKDLFQSWDVMRMKFLGVNTVLMAREKGKLVAVSSTPILGRARWISRAESAPDHLAATQRALKDGAWAQTVFLEERAGSPSGSGGERPSGATVACQQDRPTRSEWTVSAPADGYLLLRDLYWPGWRATVDGRATEILAADGVFRAVPVPAGTHEVRFRYFPASFAWGLAISGTALAALAVCVARGVRSRGKVRP